LAIGQAALGDDVRAAPATPKEGEGRREKEVELMVEMVVILW